jgi:hypothetical protein
MGVACDDSVGGYAHSYTCPMHDLRKRLDGRTLTDAEAQIVFDVTNAVDREADELLR